jgi:hypothetical protein
MDSKEAFQAESLALTLSAIGCKGLVLGLPLKIGIPRYKKGKVPITNPKRLAMCLNLA